MVWCNEVEAHEYIKSIDKISMSVVGAVTALHTACILYNFGDLEIEISPHIPIDMLMLYRTIASVVLNWNSEESIALVNTDKQYALRENEAREFAFSVIEPNIKRMLFNFIEKSVQEAGAMRRDFDILFCVALVYKVFPTTDSIEYVLSGESARRESELNNDFDKWAESWISSEF